MAKHSLHCSPILLPGSYAPRGEDDSNHVNDKSQEETSYQGDQCSLLLCEKA